TVPTDLILVRYPVVFAPACAQPTALDADWSRNDQYFVSYHNHDAWGRTQSVSAAEQPIKERIHRRFRGLTDEFEAYYVGTVHRLTENRQELLRACYNRLQAVDEPVV